MRKELTLFLFTIISLLNVVNSGIKAQLINSYSSSLLSNNPATGSFSFAVISDIHLSYANGIINFYGILNEIKNSNASFIINCGDFTGSDGSDAEYQEFYNDYMNNNTYNNIPLFCIPGNHDFRLTDGYYNYFEKIGNTLNYFFDYGNCRFVLINNVKQNAADNETDYQIPASTLANAKNWLTNAPLFRFTFTHVPFTRTNADGSSGSNGINQPGFLEMHNISVDDYVIANFSGHIHQYAQDEKDGVNYFICGGGRNDDDKITDVPHLIGDIFWVLVKVNYDTGIKLEVHHLDYGIVTTLNYPIVTINENINLTLADNHYNYYAKDSLTASNYAITNGKRVIFGAANNIKLQPGFKITNNSKFKAYLYSNIANPMAKKSALLIDTPDTTNALALKNSPTNINRMFNKDINIYPNPANNIVTIESSNFDWEIQDIIIYNLQGELVYQKRSNTYKTSIDMSSLGRGLFCISIVTQKGIYHSKILLQ